MCLATCDSQLSSDWKVGDLVKLISRNVFVYDYHRFEIYLIFKSCYLWTTERALGDTIFIACYTNNLWLKMEPGYLEKHHRNGNSGLGQPPRYVWEIVSIFNTGTIYTCLGVTIHNNMYWPEVEVITVIWSLWFNCSGVTALVRWLNTGPPRGLWYQSTPVAIFTSVNYFCFISISVDIMGLRQLEILCSSSAVFD